MRGTSITPTSRTRLSWLTAPLSPLLRLSPLSLLALLAVGLALTFGAPTTPVAAAGHYVYWFEPPEGLDSWQAGADSCVTAHDLGLTDLVNLCSVSTHGNSAYVKMTAPTSGTCDLT